MRGSNREDRLHQGSQSKWQSSVKSLFRLLWQEEEGQDLVEYALLIVLIMLALISTVSYFGQFIAGGIAGTAFLLAHAAGAP